MHKCIHIDTKQHNPTKIIDGCQGLKEILTDITAVVKIAAMQHGWIEKGEVESPMPSCGRGVSYKVAAPYFSIIMYIFQLCTEDWTILPMLGCQAIALSSTERIV